MPGVSASAFFLLVCLAGCAAPQPNVDHDDPRSKVGETVQFIGKFGGPGMQAEYVVADGQEVYLMGTTDFGGESLRYGTTVDVEGVLKFHPYVAPKSALDQSPGGYLFVQHAEVRHVSESGNSP